MSQANYTVFSETLLQRHAALFRPFLAEVGLSPEVVEHANQEIPLSRYIALLELTAEQTDPCLGLRLGLGQLSEATTASALGAFGHAARSVADVRGMLEFISRYLVVHAHANELHWYVRDDQVHICYRLTDPGISHCRQDAEFAIAGLYSTLCRVTDNQFAPLLVDFMHAEPGDTVLHRQTFQCPLRFDQPFNRLVWPGAILEQALATADQRLFQALLPYLEEQRSRRLAAIDLSARIRQVVLDNLHVGEVRLDVIAKELRLSARTLQRRLQEQALEFNALVDDIRRIKAQQYLQQSSRSITEIASGLGYAEASSFTRAFRRWTGQTPRAYRQSCGRTSTTRPMCPAAMALCSGRAGTT
ncbi:AraC family transcriptional regulator [Pseudomonas sp. GD03860]|uniref:AraC family transcriptional regulator n=1 Tax=Pseudomonas TaxID=286 RepID=UPI0023648E8C|nr:MULTISPECIES: AraC family transcriptional regulator [Pseudomonas]MDD2058517.1 AraC family transcriptional regulator [Pseudomonas putida]MDH0640667.1 AraC family transcriptional regulator [Pseudomonas sp. GD03860]